MVLHPRPTARLALGPILALGIAFPLVSLAQVKALVAPPSPYKSVMLPAATTATTAAPVPSERIVFQSRLGGTAKDRIEGWLWRPAGASATARVPMVVVAHGHTGAGTFARPKAQFSQLASELLSKGIGMMLVNSFSQPRHDYVVQKWGLAYGIVNGLGQYRPPEASDHQVRPYDLAGAADAVIAGKVNWADPHKLVAVGYSHGGTAALGLVMSRHPLNVANAAAGGRLFRKAFIAYPGCGMGSPNNYKSSGAVIPTVLGTGTADTTTPPGLPPAFASGGYCRLRFDESLAAARADTSLHAFEWWSYDGATHGWEYATGTQNLATRQDWRRKIVQYAQSLK